MSGADVAKKKSPMQRAFDNACRLDGADDEIPTLEEITTPEEARPVEEAGPVVELSVGGRVFQTTLDTLTKYPDSMLKTMFSGDFDAHKDERGRPFVDRDGDLFAVVLNALRNGALIVPAECDVRALRREFDFYQLPFYALEIPGPDFTREQLIALIGSKSANKRAASIGSKSANKRGEFDMKLPDGVRLCFLDLRGLSLSELFTYPTRINFDGCSFGETECDGNNFNDCSFRGLSAEKNTVWRDCHFSMCDWNGSTHRRSLFKRCTFFVKPGSLDDALFEDCEFDGCEFHDPSEAFSEATFVRTAAKGCKVTDRTVGDWLCRIEGAAEPVPDCSEPSTKKAKLT